MGNMTDLDWGRLIARFLGFLWNLRWLALSAILFGMHKLWGIPWWLVLVPPAYWYIRAWLVGALIKWSRKNSQPAPNSTSLKGSLLDQNHRE